VGDFLQKVCKKIVSVIRISPCDIIFKVSELQTVKELEALLNKNMDKLGEEAEFSFINGEGEVHPLISWSVHGKSLTLLYGDGGQFQSEVFNDDLQSIEFDAQGITGIDAEGESFEISFVSKNTDDTTEVVDSAEDFSEIEDDDEEGGYSDEEDPYTDDDYSIKTSDDY